MKVLQLISSSCGYYGAERVVVTLSRALEEQGVRSVVGTFLNTAKIAHIEVHDHAKAAGLQTELIRCQGRLDRQAVRAIREIIERHEIDVIHCHGIKPLMYAYLAARHLNVSVVSTCHLWFFGSKKEWLISALERCLLRTCDRVVGVADHIMPQLRRFGVRGEVIHNGIDLTPFANPQAGYRPDPEWTGRPVIGALGRLTPQKGLHYLLQAAPEVLLENPQTLFVFAGDGPERDSLETEAKQLGIIDSVRFLGVRNDVPKLLSSIDVLAMPSTDEGLPMALLEAMASGRAVVASSVGAIPKVIQNRVNGILLPPGDVPALASALRELVNNREARLELGRSARETIEQRFSAAAMARQYRELYGECSPTHDSRAAIQDQNGAFSARH
jgi:glycosyltransferase involved in cell wall biosynthesis